MKNFSSSPTKKRSFRAVVLLLGTAIILSACASKGINIDHLSDSDMAVSLAKAPTKTRDGSCWARDETPAKIQTTTEKIEVTPAEIGENGEILEPATYRTETSQLIVQKRDEIWFEAPCSETIGEDFIVNLQRALNVRGYYNGPISGVMDSSTRQSVRKYQQGQGLNSSIVSLEAAQQLGLSNFILQ